MAMALAMARCSAIVQTEARLRVSTTIHVSAMRTNITNWNSISHTEAMQLVMFRIVCHSALSHINIRSVTSGF